MADQVEQVMQDMVPELDDLSRKRIFNQAELKQIIRRRRDFEYLLHRTPSKPQDYLGYVQYEVALECLRKRRSKAQNWRRKTLSDYAGIGRMHSIFNRGLAKFKSDTRLWYQHVDFCLRSGSSKILSKVLMKAVKFHPREVHFWLLAADRELKLGHIKAARALLMRGIRFSPGSPKLWGEFVRLEAQVARNLCSLRRAEVASEAEAAQKASSSAFAQPAADGAAPKKELSAETDVWAPARLIFRRSLKKLDAKPQSCVAFLMVAVPCVEEAVTSQPVTEGAPSLAASGLQQWQQELWAAVAERRTGTDTAPPAWADAADDEAMQLWHLWWMQERAQGRGWRGVAKDVLAHAPLAAVRHCASFLGEAAKLEEQSSGAPMKALLSFITSERVASDEKTGMAVLEALESNISFSEVQEHASTLLSVRAGASEVSGPCVRLRLLAMGTDAVSTQRKAVVGMLREASDLTSTYAAQIFAVITSKQATGADEVLDALLHALVKGASPRPLVEAFLAKALLQGLPAFHAACTVVLAIGAKLWEAPQLRAAMLAVVLEGELRVSTPTASSAQSLQAKFEELVTLLHDADPAKVDCWVQYLEFVQQASHYGCAEGLPTMTTLHWRAMRSVADQALYTERSQKLMTQL